MHKMHHFMALLLGVSLSGSVLAGSAASDITVIDGGFVRSTPPEQTVTGAFFDLENTGSEPHYLTEVKSEIAPRVELHRTVTQGKDMMSMKKVDKLEIEGHKKLALQPGGNHVMLMDLTKPVSVGEKVQLMLVFEDGSQLPVKLLVRDARD